MLSNLSVDLVIHRLELDSICNSRDKQGWVMVDVACPWFVDELIPNNIVVVFELLSNIAPELGELVSKPIVIVIKVTYSRAQGLCEMVIWPVDRLASINGWVVIFIHLEWIS